MRYVEIYRYPIAAMPSGQNTIAHRGRFHGWGSDAVHEEGGGDVGASVATETVALVELADGTIHGAHWSHVRFADRLPEVFRAEDFGISADVPSEPAPGSDAEHPPVGYRLEPFASEEIIKSDWIVWAWNRGPWDLFTSGSVGNSRNKSSYPVARPIPANEGDSQKTEYSADRVQQLEAENKELRATVERLEAENADLRKTNRSYHMTITDLNDRLRMVREAAR